MIKQKYMIVLTGPTGVGKTDFSLELSHQLPSEIINADLGQMYTPLNIGTAKPRWKESTVRHHLFDIFDKPEQCTVVYYRTLLMQSIHDIWNRGKIPIIVGGSQFYVQSIFFPPISGKTAQDQYEQYSITKSLWEQLHDVDPERAQSIHPNDSYRLKRALEIWFRTGHKPSSLEPQYNPPSNYLFIMLTRDREELYQRINFRVKSMIDHGWLHEVQHLSKEWQDFLLTKKLIGYDTIIKYPAQHEIDHNVKILIETIAQKTRNYAKRQLTFLRMLEKKLQEQIPLYKTFDKIITSRCVSVNLTLVDLTLYINQLSQKLQILW